MANLKISELPYLASIDDNMEFAVVNNQSTPETQKVTITGMTFQGGSTTYNSLNGIADPATPIVFTGDATSFIITGDTFNTKRYESNVITSATITYRTTGGTPADISYARLDVDSSGAGRDIYLTDTNGAWNTVSFTTRDSNLSNGSHNLDLTVNLANGVIFEFAQIYIAAFER